MILAAGRGERMRPLTDTTPKPLLSVGGKPLIVWHLERLAQAGFRDIVINHAWLGHRLEEELGAGQRWGVRIQWSPEPHGGLETAGGIAKALPLLGQDPFLVINGDIWCDWSPAYAPALVEDMNTRAASAWLLMVDNPPHHQQGDFWLAEDAGQTYTAPCTSPMQISNESPEASGRQKRLTFSGIGIYQPRLFTAVQAGQKFPLAPILRQAMHAGLVVGNRHQGRWVDVGTPERLRDLDVELTGA